MIQTFSMYLQQKMYSLELLMKALGFADFDNTESVHHNHDYMSTNPGFKTLSCYMNDVVEHMAGFAVKKLKITLKCVTCFSILEDSCIVNLCRLIYRKNRGGLIILSDDAITICKTSEKSFCVAQA